MASFKLSRNTGGGVVAALAGPSMTLVVSDDAKIEPAKSIVSVLRRKAIREILRVDDSNDSFVRTMSISVRGSHRANRTAYNTTLYLGFRMLETKSLCAQEAATEASVPSILDRTV